MDPDAMDALRKWSHELGTVRALSRDENGELPEVDMLAQRSAQPMVMQLRELAAEFAGITSIPVGSLGIVQDNVSSAEAITAAREDLVVLAERTMSEWGSPLSEFYEDLLWLLGEPSVPVHTHWRDPSHPSIVSRSDGLAKQIAALPWLGETDVVLEKLGYTHDEILRMQAQHHQAQVLAVMSGGVASPGGSR